MKHHHKAKFNSAGTEPFTEPPPTPAPKPHTRFHGIDWILWFVLIPGLILFFTAEIWGFCAMTSWTWKRIHHSPEAVSQPAMEAEQFGIVLGKMDELEAAVNQMKPEREILFVTNDASADLAMLYKGEMEASHRDYNRTFEELQKLQALKPNIITQYLHLPPMYLWKTNTVEHTNWQWHAVQMRR